VKIEEAHANIEFCRLPEAVVIPGQIRQLFTNLLSNSLKYIRPGICPMINISHSYVGPNDVSHLELKEARQYLKIIFTDNGIGFENEFAQKIFVIFQRLHPKTEYAGTGIGLAICRKIVQNHGGAIRAFGRPGEGAEFTIYLPI
jgi:signal transduction histidine kinase